MSSKEVLSFLAHVENDADLQKQLRSLDAQNEAHLPQLLQIAAGAGFAFSADEWRSVGKQKAEALQAKYWGLGEAELSDEELSAVAGGKSRTADEKCDIG